MESQKEQLKWLPIFLERIAPAVRTAPNCFWTDSSSRSNGIPSRSNGWWTAYERLSVSKRQTVRNVFAWEVTHTKLGVNLCISLYFWIPLTSPCDNLLLSSLIYALINLRRVHTWLVIHFDFLFFRIMITMLDVSLNVVMIKILYNSCSK